MKLILFIVSFFSFILLFFASSNQSYANHAPSTSRMASRFMHNNGSTNWQVAYKFWYTNNSGRRQGTGNTWFKWTNQVSPFLSFDWSSNTTPYVDFGPNSGRHPVYRIQWGTTCIDPKDDPVVSVTGYPISVYVFYSDVTYGPNSADNTGRDIGYAYGNDISNRTDQCPFNQPPPCVPNFSSCGTNRCGSSYWDGCKNVDCNGCPAGETCTAPNGQGSCVVRYGCNNNGQCVQKQGGSYTGSTCGGSSSDPQGNCNGPISGQVFLPGGNGYNGMGILRDGNATQITSGNGNYGWPFLETGTQHDVRLAKRGDNTPFNANQKVNTCVYNLQGNEWIRNRRVPNSNIDFNLNFERYNINANAKLDINADGIGLVPYTTGNVSFTAQPDGNSCFDGNSNNGACAITGNRSEEGGRDYTVTVGNLAAGDMTIIRDPSTGSMIPGGRSKGVTITCGPKNVGFLIARAYSVSGLLYNDLNFNARYNPASGENGFNGTIQIEPLGRPGFVVNPNSIQTGANGKYTFNRLLAGRYRVTYASFDPNGNKMSIPTNSPPSFTITVGPGCNDAGHPEGSCASGSITDLNFGVTPIYSVSGGGFIDDGIAGDDFNADPNFNAANGANQRKDSMEGYMTGHRVEIKTKAGTPNHPRTFTTTTGATGFSFSDLFEGSYTVTYTWPTSIEGYYDPSYPTAIPTYNITLSRPVDPNCIRPRGGEGICTALGISNLNFSIKPIQARPWMQTFGGDVRLDNGFYNPIPGANPPEYFSNAYSVSGSTLSPGIVFGTGTINLGLPNQKDRSNDQGWYVGGNTYPSTQPIKTSYAYLDSVIKDSGNADRIFLLSSSSYSSLPLHSKPGNETLIYKSNGDLNINGTFTFANNKDYIFLVAGNLNINSNITVPRGATAMFAVNGNITVDGNVVRIEGIYSATGNFVFNTRQNPSTKLPRDNPLIIEGSIVSSATVRKDRALTPSDSIDNPTYRLFYRPDFILNSPAILRSSNSKRIEVAPGE